MALSLSNEDDDFSFDLSQKGASKIDLSVRDKNGLGKPMRIERHLSFKSMDKRVPKTTASTMSEAINKYGSPVPGYSVTTNFHNFTADNIYIIEVNRPAICIPVCNSPNISRDEVVVRKIYTFSSPTALQDILRDSESYVAINGEYDNPEMVTFIGAVRKKLKEGVGNSSSIVFDYVYKASQIRAFPIYVKELNTVIASKPDVYHPDDSNSKFTKTALEIASKSKFSGVLVEFIDNDRKYQSRFINTMGQVTEIKSSQDPSRANGLHILKVESSDDAEEPVFKRTRIDLEEAEKDKIVFTTHEEASGLGCPVKRAELELLATKERVAKLTNENLVKSAVGRVEKTDLEIETIKNSKDLVLTKNKYENIDIKRKSKSEKKARKLKELEHQLEIARKEKISAMQDYYERRSYERKDSSEAFKAGHVMAAGVVGMLTAGLAIYANSKK